MTKPIINIRNFQNQENCENNPRKNSSEVTSGENSFLCCKDASVSIFIKALTDLSYPETPFHIRATCRSWEKIMDKSVFDILYYDIKGFFLNSPFLTCVFQQTREVIQSLKLQGLQPTRFQRLKILQNRIIISNPYLYLFSEQYEKLFDDSLVKIWEKISPSFNFQGDTIQKKAQEIRNWINDPANQDKIQGVTRLFLASQHLKVLPPEIKKFTSLQSLNLNDNELTTLPAEIGELVQLERLSIETNNLTTLPAEIGNLINLKSLDLYSNALTTLPASIGNLKNLKKINLRENRLTTLPASIGNLKNLKKVNLRENRLTTLPDGIGNVKKLIGSQATIFL
jgi:Leucine-rich repeat (LRR) protein